MSEILLFFLLTLGAAHAQPKERDGAAQTLRLLDADTNAVLAALPAGFDPKHELIGGYTLLAVAAVADDSTQIKKLVAAGFDPKIDTSALDVAAVYGASNAFTVLLDMVQPTLGSLDELAYRSLNDYFVQASGRQILMMGAQEILGQEPPSPTPGACPWQLLSGLISQRIESESDGHLKILALLKARGASLDVVPGDSKTFAALTLERGEIYLNRQILSLNGQLATFAVDTAIASAIQNGNAASLAYLVSLASDRFTSSARVKLLESHLDKLTAATFEVISTPDIALPKELATKLLTRFAADPQSYTLQRLIQSGADVRADAPRLLRLAALAGSVENVRLLLAAGAAPNTKSADGRFVLAGLADAVIEARKGYSFDACSADRRRDNLLTVSRLLIKGGAPLAADDKGALVFDGFLTKGYLDGDFVEMLTPTSSSQAQAAVASASSGNLDFVKWFVEFRGVPVTVSDASGRSLFQASLLSSNADEVAPYVLARLDSVEGLLDAATAVEALEHFFKLKCNICVQKLLETTMDLNHIPASGSLLINTALQAADLALASKLLELGASPLLADMHDNRAVDFLCRRDPKGQTDIPAFRRSLAQLFLSNNVDLRGVNYGSTSLLFDCFTASSRDETILDVILLLNGGVIEPALVEDALARSGRVELEWFKRKHVNLAGSTPNGTPFLHVAIHSDNIAAFNMLLEQPSVDVSAEDAASESALELAFRMKRAPMARLLVAAGAALPQDAKGLSRFVSTDNDLADVLLMDLLSKQVLAEVPKDDDELRELIERMEAANKASVAGGSWSLEASEPWNGFAPYSPPAGIFTAEVEYPNSEIGVRLLTTLTPHRYAAIARSKSAKPQDVCMPPNICYKRTCGYCSLYEFRIATQFTLPSCAPVAAQECLSTSSIENDVMSGATLTVTQTDRPALTVSPGSSVLVERSHGPIDVKVSTLGTTFYTRFMARMDDLPEWPSQPAVFANERLRIYMRALSYQDFIAGAPDQMFYSTESTIVAHRYWSAKMTQARYAEAAAEKLRADLKAVETVPAIFDRLFESLSNVEQLGEVQLPVLVQQVQALAQVMDGALRDRLSALAKELESATGKVAQATARLLEVRDELLAHHRVLADSLRLNLLEYLQYGDRVKNSPLKQMSKVRKEAAIARLRPKPGEIISQSWRDRDAALIGRLKKTN